jgi:hypothetical protein
MDNEQIVQELSRLDAEAKEIKNSVIRMAWYMRGGTTIAELLESSNLDREMINSLIKENLDTTKKSGMPFF